MSSLSELQEKMLEDNYRLVPFCVRKYFSPSYDDFDDYVQIGSIGLFKAVRTYRPEVGMFSTYAAKCIRNELLHFIRIQGAKRRTPDQPNISMEAKVSERTDLRLFEVIPDKNDPIGAAVTSMSLSVAFEKLTPKEKEVFTLYFNGNSERVISIIFHTSQAAISRVLKRARNKLQMELVS